MIDFSAVSRSTAFGRAIRWPLRLIPRQMDLPILQGPLKGKRWISGSANHGCWLGSYESTKQSAISSVVRPGMVCWDIGANAGFYTLLFAELVGSNGHVYSFEPAPLNVQHLARHVEMNACSNVGIFPCAVGDVDGEVSFDLGPDAHMGKIDENGQLRVSCRKIATLLSENQLLPPDVIKIDVEGAEADVLRGAEGLLDRRPIIFLATHGAHVHQQCLKLLSEKGYNIKSLDDRPPESTDELLAI